MSSFHDRKIRQFIRDTGLPFNQAPEALGLHPSEFLEWWTGRLNVVSQRELSSLGQYLHIDEKEIMEGTYDRQFVRSIIYSDDPVLPERYSQNQFSFVRSSAHIFKYLSLKHGQHFSDLIMRKLNVSPHLYANLNNKISMNYFMDLLEVLAENGYRQHDLDRLACLMFLSLDQSPAMKAEFKNAKNYYECYAAVAKNFKNLDSNFETVVELDRERFLVSMTLSYDNHTQIDFKNASLEKLLRYRLILAGWFSYLSNLPPLIPVCKTTYLPNGIRCDYTFRFPIEGASRFFVAAENGLPLRG